jgi:acyl-CoA dehydrogenase
MAIDFELDDALAGVRDFVHAFAEQELRPLAREADTKGVLPMETIRKLGGFAGGRASVVPRETGKRAIGNMMAVIGSEELAWGDPAVVMNIPGPGLAGPSIMAAGTDEQKQRFLHDIFDDDSGEPRFGALAVTEPQAGSDVSNVQTTATRDGDEWVLNGTKIYCTNGARSEIVVVNATVDKGAGRAGQKFFVVPKGAPGFKVGKIEKKMGLTASPLRSHPRRRGGPRAEGVRLQGNHEDLRFHPSLGRRDGPGDRTSVLRVRARLGRGGTAGHAVPP